jgi:hypothetical protein
MQEIDLSAEELSAIFSLSDAEISRLARSGVLPRKPNPDRQRSYLYPLVACARAYIRHLTSENRQNQEAYTREKARTEKERARKLELENQLKEGRLLDREEVLAEIRSEHAIVKRRLLVLAQRAARRVAAESDPVIVQELLTEEVLDCL